MDALQLKSIIAKELKKEINSEACELLLKDIRLVLEANKKVNLTSINSEEKGIYLHLIDSLVCLEEFNKAPEGAFIDIGTGGGFPGIPLSLVTGRKGILLDSVGKKVDAVNGFIEKLGCKDHIKGVCARSEDYAKQHAFAYAVVTARAVAQLSVVMELATPLLAQGGWLIALKAQPEDSEMDHAQEIAPMLGLQHISTRKVTFNDDEEQLIQRTIVVYKRDAEPTIELPRRPGRATKRPL